MTIPEPFAVGRFEVTRGEYAEFVRSTGHASELGTCWFYDSDEKWKESDTLSWRNPGFSQGEDDPVVCVSWEDARAYVSWLSRETGEEYRLLTESEWEYVARAGTTGPFHFGLTISTDQANYNGNYTYGGVARGYIAGILYRLAVFLRTCSDCMMCTAMHGSGLRTAGMTVTTVRRPMVVHGLGEETAANACCVAAPGSSIRGSSVRRFATGTGRGTGSTTSGSVSPGRLPLDSLHPYIGVPRGGAPWPNISDRCGLIGAGHERIQQGLRTGERSGNWTLFTGSLHIWC